MTKHYDVRLRGGRYEMWRNTEERSTLIQHTKSGSQRLTALAAKLNKKNGA